ncbi:hypothetical protein B0H14DRAFT_2650439 [Mycena olivaceomarginata]|nr:hypothetical protein B0H14DRAFT_2650439 [Mycena olivaceomarginata]
MHTSILLLEKAQLDLRHNIHRPASTTVSPHPSPFNPSPFTSTMPQFGRKQDRVAAKNEERHPSIMQQSPDTDRQILTPSPELLSACVTALQAGRWHRTQIYPQSQLDAVCNQDQLFLEKAFLSEQILWNCTSTSNSGQSFNPRPNTCSTEAQDTEKKKKTRPTPEDDQEDFLYLLNALTVLPRSGAELAHFGCLFSGVHSIFSPPFHSSFAVSAETPRHLLATCARRIVIVAWSVSALHFQKGTQRIWILESLRKATLSEGGLESGDSQKASTCFPRFECMKWVLV